MKHSRKPFFPGEGEQEGEEVWGAGKVKETVYLHQLPRELIGEKLLFFLIVDGKGFFLLLQGLDFLE